jgi:hypothetical protein
MATALLESLAIAQIESAPAPSDGDIIDVVVWLDQAMNRIAGLRASAIDIARTQSERGLASPVDRLVERRAFTAEIASALRVSERAAENLIGTSKALVQTLPATLEALGSGAISYRHAQIMIDHAAGLEPEDTAELERVVLDRAKSCSPPRFNSHVRTMRERLHPESIEARHRAAVEDRSVVLEESRDGMAWISAHLSAPHAHAIFDRLTTAALSLHAEKESRTLAQRRADLFTTVLLESDGSLTGTAPSEDDSAQFVRWFRGITPQVIVAVPALSLLGASSEPATLEGYGPIDLHTARVLAARAPSFVRVLTHPETGATLSVGRKRYKVPRDLRMWLRARDGTCRFVGCGRRAERCDIDHTIEWQHGGLTVHDNLAHLCRRHHMMKGIAAGKGIAAEKSVAAERGIAAKKRTAGEKNTTAWEVTQSSSGDGTLTWRSPTGRTYTTHPETVVGGLRN